MSRITQWKVTVHLRFNVIGISAVLGEKKNIGGVQIKNKR